MLTCQCKLDSPKGAGYALFMSPNAQFLTDKDGNKTAVLLPIAEYEQLLEDLEDLASIAERRKEPTISHEQLIQELKNDGSYRLE